jgi:hypothetical protein
MSVIVSFTIWFLSLIKKPIKKLTSKIKNPRLRKLTNKIFVLLAFAISFASWVSLNIIAPSYFPLEALEILLTGSFSIVIYSLGDGVITKSSAKALVEQITEVVDEAKEKEKNEETKSESAIQEYLNKVK